MAVNHGVVGSSPTGDVYIQIIRGKRVLIGNNMAKQTPIEEIIGDKPYLGARALNFCRKYKIETAEQLATYNRWAFQIMGVATQIATVNYLEECLNKANLSFSDTPKRHGRQDCGFKIIGKENIKNYILDVMGDVPYSRTEILRAATKKLEKTLNYYLKRVDYNYVHSEEVRCFTLMAFHYNYAFPLFDELEQEGRIARAPRACHRGTDGFYLLKDAGKREAVTSSE
tara:strand:+ start:179 stop:859 length:681 start_codon:yes stop_codon:yes gene_type:complete